MDISFTLWLFAIAAATSALGGMLGMASGIFIVPVLTTFGHVEIHQAIGASLISVIACSCAGAAPFLKNRLTNVRLAVVLEVATTLGALTGVLLAGIIPVAWLYLLFAMILFVSAQQMFAKRSDPLLAEAAELKCRWATLLRLHHAYPDAETGGDVEHQVHRLPVGMTLMYGAGLVSALLGIGSGVLKIPAMDTGLRLPIKISSATSNFMIGVTATASAAAYFMKGSIVPSLAAPVALGSFAGAILGAHVLIRVSNEKLRIFFVAILVLLGAQMVMSGLEIHVY